MTTTYPLPLQRLAAVVLFCGALLVGCNDKPTDVGSILVPGTDTLYATSSSMTNLLVSTGTTSIREPIYNSTFVLFGKTQNSESRLFVEFINYPDLGDPDSFSVVSSDLLMYPEDYRFGDTLDATMSLKAFELQQAWSAQATWDSIWAEDGSTPYYSESQPLMADFSTTIEPSDTIVRIPFDLDATKRWLTLGADSTGVQELFGLVLLPTNTSSIRQYRFQEDLETKLRLRVITQHADSTEPDTSFINAVVAAFVDTPEPVENEQIVQGAHKRYASFEIRIDTLPEFAILLGSKLRLTVETNRSQVGTGGLDEILSLVYRSDNGDQVTLVTRGNGAGVFEFTNIVPLLQVLRENGGVGTVQVTPTDRNEFWRMNRLWIYPTGTSDESLAPFMTLVYTVPTVLQ